MAVTVQLPAAVEQNLRAQTENRFSVDFEVLLN